jgi:hypothetical protein
MDVTAVEGEADPTRIELWLRSLGRPPVAAQQSDIVDRLYRLETSSVVEETTVGVWGDRVIVSAETAGIEPGRRFLHRLSRIQHWASGTDVSLEPHFETKTTESNFTGEEYTVVIPPAFTLLEYDQDDLLHVAPATVDGTLHGVADRLETLEGRLDLEEYWSEAVDSSTTSDAGPTASGSGAFGGLLLPSSDRE